jgi:hypothetical protein
LDKPKTNQQLESNLEEDLEEEAPSKPNVQHTIIEVKAQLKSKFANVESHPMKIWK